MKILFVMHNCDRFSGANLAMQELIDDLVNNYGINPVILYPEQENMSAMDLFIEKDIKCCTAQYWPQLFSKTDSKLKNLVKLPLLGYREIVMRKSLEGLVDDVKDVDLIYTNTSTIKFGIMLAQRYHKAHVWHIREFINLDHRLIFPFGEKQYFKVESRLKNGSEIIVISQCLSDVRVPYFGKEKIHLVYDDVALSYINPEKSNNEKNVNILIAGDIKAGKGQLIATKAVGKLVQNSHREIHLYIAGKIGDNDYKNVIELYIDKELLGENIHFLGRVDDMNNLRKKMHIAIVSSTSEAFGRVTVEAMLSKMAVIGRNAGATPEIIQDGVTGLLYDGSVDDLSNKIIKLLDEDLRSKIANSSFDYAVEEYTTKKCCHKVWNVINVVLNKQGEIEYGRK